jgi:flagellar basal body rod protein FlgC
MRPTDQEQEMTSRFVISAAAAMLLLGTAGAVFAQSASTVGTGAGSAGASGSSGVAGTGGSAAAGGTAASGLGLGAESTTPNTSSSSLATGGSAAAANGRAMSRSGVHGTNNLNGQTMNQAHQPGGDWSKVHTVTHDRHGTIASRTKSMAHEPGGPPAKSTSTVNLGQ